MTPITKHTGDLVITQANAEKYAHLQEVRGDLDISADAKLDALTSVGGYLSIRADAKLDAPALTKVSGHDLPSPEVAAARLRDVAGAALLVPQALKMSDWHTCETTHCIAGWGIHQAGPDGYKLEKAVGSAAAGAILLGLEAAHHFHVSEAKAREWLASKLEAA